MAVTIYQLNKPWIWVEAVAGGSLADNTTYYFIGWNSHNVDSISAYYGWSPGKSSDEVSVTTDTVNKKILMELYQLGGYITGYADTGDATHVTVTTSVEHGLSNGNTVYLRGTANYVGYYTISSVTSSTFDIIATWVSDDGASNWYSQPGIPANINGTYYTTFSYKWDYYSMLRPDGSKMQWFNTNDPAYTNEWYVSNATLRGYGHRRWCSSYYYRGMMNIELTVGTGGTRYRYLDEVITSSGDVYGYTTKMYDASAGSVNGQIAHPEIALRKWGDAAATVPLFQLPNGMTEDCAGCTIYIDNSNYNNKWSDVVTALRNSGAIGKSVIMTNDNENNTSSIERDRAIIIRGIILQQNATFTTRTIFYDRDITLLQGRIHSYFFGSVVTNKIHFEGCHLNFSNLSSSYWQEPSFTAKNTTYRGSQLFLANLSAGMTNFSPACYQASQPTTYGSLTDYNFTGSTKFTYNQAQVIRYPTNGMYARRINFTWCCCYPTPSVAGNVTLEYTDIAFKQPQSDLAISNDSSVYNMDFYLISSYMVGKDGTYTINCYNVTSEDRADKIVRVTFNNGSTPGYTASTTFNFKFHFPLNLKIIDENGDPINGASVIVSNSKAIPDVYSLTTDINGDAPETNVLCYTIEYDPTNPDGYATNINYKFWSKTTMVNDLSLSISKDGYENYSTNLDNVLSKQSLTYTLKTAKPIRISTDGAILALEPALGSSSLLKKL